MGIVAGPVITAGGVAMDMNRTGAEPGDVLLFFSTCETESDTDTPSSGFPSGAGWTRLFVSNPAAGVPSRGSIALYRCDYDGSQSLSSIGPVVWASGGTQRSLAVRLRSNRGAAITIGRPPSGGLGAYNQRDTASDTSLTWAGWLLDDDPGDLLIAMGGAGWNPTIPLDWNGVIQAGSSNIYVLAFKPNGASSEPTSWELAGSSTSFGISLTASDGFGSDQAYGALAQAYGNAYPLPTASPVPNVAPEVFGGGISIV